MGAKSINSFRLILSILFSLGALLANQSSTNADGLNKPVKCQPEGCYGRFVGPNVMDNTWAGELIVEPPVLRIGQTLKVIVIAYTEGYPVSVTVPAGVKVLSKCPTKGSGVCKFKVTAATKGWTKINASIANQAGNGTEQECFKVMPKKPGEQIVTGRISSKELPGKPKGIGIKGVEVLIYTKKGQQKGKLKARATTNSDGYYIAKFKAKKGESRFIVSPSARASDVALLGFSVFNVSEASLRLDEDGDEGKADFQLNRGNTLITKFEDGAGNEIGSLPADGLGHAVLSIKGIDPNDEPLSGKELTMTVNHAQSAVPRALLCQPSNIPSIVRVWPARTSSGPDYSFIVYGTNLYLDSNGELKIDTYTGSEPGVLDVTTTLKGSTDLDGATLSLIAQAQGDFAPFNFSQRVYDATTIRGQFNDIVKQGAPYQGANVLPLLDQRGASEVIARYFSTERSGFSGYDMAPLVLNTSKGYKYLIAFYPASSIVRGSDGRSFTIADPYVLEPLAGFDQVVQLFFQGGIFGATIQNYNLIQPKTLSAWLVSISATMSGTPVVGLNSPSVLFGGGPYAAGDLASNGRYNGCAS